MAFIVNTWPTSCLWTSSACSIMNSPGSDVGDGDGDNDNTNKKQEPSKKYSENHRTIIEQKLPKSDRWESDEWTRAAADSTWTREMHSSRVERRAERARQLLDLVIARRNEVPTTTRLCPQSVQTSFTKKVLLCLYFFRFFGCNVGPMI